MADWITIANEHLTAAINPLGAELSSLKDADGRELMTNADPAFWTGRAPLLFPVVGKPADETIRVDGGLYPMKQHGFARRLPFAVIEQGNTRALFRLTASEETRTHYPFDFTLDALFRLDDATLCIEITIHNPADTPLPASFGFHPAFAWPLPYGRDRADHRITFARDEPTALRVIAADGTIAPGTKPSPLDGRTLALADDLFVHDALVWDPVRSTRVCYGASDGPSLEIAFPDTPMLGIWTKPGAQYICVEPWHGIADPEGYAGELADKPGIFLIPPGGAKHIVMSVTRVP
ncbi:aldose 1-epimerase family protein [Sphingomonas radiodurans]|uniref:aldose 1-epimerase family protein n=1 Tax=Sphingomonas radiodurans TaxID=2890321 RepID=UPI001E59E83D|nr:aldose 1-epimerase family protein [Sphingomonas radiodurans]WBH17660.1 aldose 1-epimerase family protein [Sphingomonas radiodurans]